MNQISSMQKAIKQTYRSEFGGVPRFLCTHCMWKLDGLQSRILYYPCSADLSFCPRGAKKDQVSCTMQREFGDVLDRRCTTDIR